MSIASNVAGLNGASAGFSYLSGGKTASVTFTSANVVTLPYTACGVSRYTVPTATSYSVMWGTASGYGPSVCWNCYNGNGPCLATGWYGYPTETSCFQKCLSTSEPAGSSHQWPPT